MSINLSLSAHYICINHGYIFRATYGEVKCMQSFCWEVVRIHATVI